MNRRRHAANPRHVSPNITVQRDLSVGCLVTLELRRRAPHPRRVSRDGPCAGLSEGQVPSVTKPSPFVTDDGEGRRTLSTGQPRAPLCTVRVEQIVVRCNEIEAVTKRIDSTGTHAWRCGAGGPRSDRSSPLSTGAGASSRPVVLQEEDGGLPRRRTSASVTAGRFRADGRAAAAAKRCG